MARRTQKLELTWYNKDRALIPTEHGKYGYTWVHPKDPRYCETRRFVIDDEFVGQQSPKDEKLAYSDRADLEPQTDNLLIHGESGDVLEALTLVPELAEKYAGQVKCIYIDPPFNTGELTFDHYDDNLEHSMWLTMMRDRLDDMHTLLSNHGSIWVHLDDHESHRMRVLLDEVFGPLNFVAEIVWEKTYSPRNDAKGISSSTDTILVYRKSSRWFPRGLPRESTHDERYTSIDGDSRLWTSGDAAAPGGRTHQGMVYGVQHPITGKILYPTKGRHWSRSQSEVLETMNNWAPYELRDIDDAAARASVCGLGTDEVRTRVPAVMIHGDLEQAAIQARRRYDHGDWPDWYFTRGGTGGIRRKKRLDEVKANVTPKNLWPYSEVGHTDGAKKEIRALFPDLTPFDTPKPERLLERIVHIATEPGDIVLDVFAGSGTTAAVAQKMGRRWVTCELLGDTIEKYNLPRLQKVISDSDPGGITLTDGDRIPANDVELPNEMTPDEAQRLTSLLNKAIKDDDGLKKDPTVKTIKAMVKTMKTPTVVNWRGGGGFRTAHLSPPCFDYDPELGAIFLTDAAANFGVLAASVAAQLGFRYTPNSYFHGEMSSARLFVTRVPVDADLVTDVCLHLGEREVVTIASTMVLDGARRAARNAALGSRVVHIPHDLFTLPEEDA